LQRIPKQVKIRVWLSKIITLVVPANFPISAVASRGSFDGFARRGDINLHHHLQQSRGIPSAHVSTLAFSLPKRFQYFNSQMGVEGRLALCSVGNRSQLKSRYSSNYVTVVFQSKATEMK
jgi:hypothetical protein